MHFRNGLFALSLVLFGSPSFASHSHAAKPTAPPPPAAADAEPPGPKYNWQSGPQAIDLGHELQLDLPADYAFLGMPEAKALMESLGNLYNENLLGVVIAGGGDSPWFITVRYTEEGHVDDSEAIDADKLLKAIQQGTLEANEERVKRGFSAAHVDGWDEAPKYDHALHQLVWALTMKTTRGKDSLNYSTRILGRRGYVAINLVTGVDRFASDRPQAAKILSVTRFKQGARYEDFDKKTDKVAEYGLMGLILGGVGIGALKLAKVGLFAAFGKSIWAFILIAKKAVVLFFVGIWAAIKKRFGKKQEPQNVAANMPPPPDRVDPPLVAPDVKPPSGSEPPPDDFK